MNDKQLMSEMLDALFTWSLDRSPIDNAEKKLMAAYYQIRPKVFPTKDTCSCDYKDECDECLSREEMNLKMQEWRNLND